MLLMIVFNFKILDCFPILSITATDILQLSYLFVNDLSVRTALILQRKLMYGAYMLPIFYCFVLLLCNKIQTVCKVRCF